MAMTNQQAFNKSAKHLLTQNKRSINLKANTYDSNVCLYRSPDGSKCAIGALISDKEYRASMEGTCASELVRHALPHKFRNVSTDMLQDLQEMHDENKPSTWGGKLRVIAKRYDLDSSVTRKE